MRDGALRTSARSWNSAWARRRRPAHSPQNPVDETLATADRLIAETGARNLTPLVLLERAASPAWAENGAMRRALLDRRLLAGAT